MGLLYLYFYLHFHIEILSSEKGSVDFIGLSKKSMTQEKIKEPLPSIIQLNAGSIKIFWVGKVKLVSDRKCESG